MDKDTNSVVELMIMNGSSMQYGAPRVIKISIRDKASGQMLVEVPMNADQLLAALAGTMHGRMPAWVCPPEYRSRIGLKSQHKQVKVDKNSKINDALNLISRAKRTKNDPFPSTIVPGDVKTEDGTVYTWLRDAMHEDDGWDEWRITLHNYGWALHLTRYVDPATVEPEPWERDL